MIPFGAAGVEHFAHRISTWLHTIAVSCIIGRLHQLYDALIAYWCVWMCSCTRIRTHACGRVRAFEEACTLKDLCKVFIAACIQTMPAWLNERLLVCVWLWQVRQSVTCSCIANLLTPTGILFLDPTFFPRLSYSVEGKMLGTDGRSRLFDDNSNLFAPQYFCTVPISIISFPVLVHGDLLELLFLHNLLVYLLFLCTSYERNLSILFSWSLCSKAYVWTPVFVLGRSPPADWLSTLRFAQFLQRYSQNRS